MKKRISKIVPYALAAMLIGSSLGQPLYVHAEEVMTNQEETAGEASFFQGEETGNSAEVSDAVCEINGIQYTSLKDAVTNAQQGDKITLLSNVILQETNASDTRYGLWIDKSLVIDGQGLYTIDMGTFARGIGVEGADTSDAMINVVFQNITLNHLIDF